MRHKMGIGGVWRRRQDVFDRGKDLLSQHPGPDWSSGRLLNGFHPAQRIVQFGVRSASDPHAAEVANVAAISATRVEGDDIAGVDDLIDREIGGVQRAPGSCFNRRAPESAVFGLRVLHRVAHVDRTVRTPLWIDDDREITRNSNRIELIKEEKTITTEHELNIVLRRDK